MHQKVLSSSTSRNHIFINCKNIQLLNDRVLIQTEVGEVKDVVGKVIAVGPGKYSNSGKLIPMTVKAGDRILVSTFVGTEITVDDEKYILITEGDILAIIRE